jgi:cytidine deaminase
MDPDKRQQLITAALQARQNAYAPYSEYQVGAAVLTKSGRIFAGCNVENASYGLTLCAERVAIVSAVAAGERDITALAVATSGGATPCGACRQFAAEFAPAMPVLLIDATKPQAAVEVSLSDLLPGQFTFKKGNQRK